MKNRLINKKNELIACAFIILFVFITYWQITGHEFVIFDDELFVTDNYYVKNGISYEGVKWAFSFDRVITYYSPLTWLSHMLDCQLFGLNAGLHILSNLIIHTCSCLIIFFWLRLAALSVFTSFFIALVFGIHPVNVESVAWVAERKNVLSTLFWFLSLYTYTRYAVRKKLSDYTLSVLFYAAGLLSKPMIVTLPFVLLLSDNWPLGRFTKKTESVISLLKEKVPYFILMAASLFVTLFYMKGDVITSSAVPYSQRAMQASVSYFSYVVKFVFPVKLSVFYPYPANTDFILFVFSLIAIFVVSISAFILIRKKPYFFTGWFWYAGTLLPAIGFVQRGLWPALADRFIYIPSMGILITVGYAIFELSSKQKVLRVILPCLCMILVLIYSAMAHRQISCWKNSETLFRQAIKVTENNYVAFNNLGVAMENKGEYDEAENLYMGAIAIRPFYSDAHNNLGKILLEKGDTASALDHFTRALEINSDSPEVLNNLGGLYLKQNDYDMALVYLRKAVAINPYYARAYANIGSAMVNKKNYTEGIINYRKALKFDPNLWEAHLNISNILLAEGNPSEAFSHALKASEIMPDKSEAHLASGLSAFQLGNFNEAEKYLQKTLSLDDSSPRALFYLAKIYSTENNTEMAIATYKKLIEKSPDATGAYYNIACLYSRVNDKEQAIKWLTSAIKKGYNNWELIENDRDLENIRNTAEFRNILISDRREGLKPAPYK